MEFYPSTVWKQWVRLSIAAEARNEATGTPRPWMQLRLVRSWMTLLLTATNMIGLPVFVWHPIGSGGAVVAVVGVVVRMTVMVASAVVMS